MIAQAAGCIRRVTEQLGQQAEKCLGIGITGQQHGTVLVDRDLRPLTPFIGWQDRRGDEPCPGSSGSFTDEARRLAGDDAPGRTGCRLATGYQATTLFWLRQHELLRSQATACFIADLFGARLTAKRPVTDPTNGASSGVLNVAARQWDVSSIERLGLPHAMFPEVREAGEALGELTRGASEMLGLLAGTRVFVALGDHQASFVGSVHDRLGTVLVNVGTGGQVAAFTEGFAYAPPLETRPYPKAGNLLVNAGLCGGRSYAVLERFFADAVQQFAGARPSAPLYEAMNLLAASVPRGADGLDCVPLFTGTRAEPHLRASWTGASPENFTPAHLVRSVLEGMGDVFRAGYERIRMATAAKFKSIVGSGNALRDNALLAHIIAEEFGLPLTFPRHCEEAAVGATLVAAVGAGAYPTLETAGRLVTSS
jgi:sugar (pentulose or hexulose) kinase